MGRLLLVRHGQASDLRGDYDQLSALGVAQAGHAGRRLQERDGPIGAVFVGPLKRHSQTFDGARTIFPKLPEGSLTTGLDEHQGQWVLRATLADARVPPEDRELPRLLAKAMRRWACEGTTYEGVTEPFAAFRSRVGQTLREIIMRSRESGEKTTVLFTSGGVVAAAVGASLNLTDAHTVELCFQVDNAAISEFVFSSTTEDSRMTLRAFNDTSHLPRELVTSL